MRQHPTLFSAPMIRAILDGRKLQTRRTVAAYNSLVDGCKLGQRGAKCYGRPASSFWAGLDWSTARVDGGPSPAGNPGPYLHVSFPAEGTVHRIYPQWQPHDLLWVRETWLMTPAGIAYRADGGEHFGAGGRLSWRPSIYMPRALSRLSLRVTGVRVARLHDISDADAMAEGVEISNDERDHLAGDYVNGSVHCDRYARLWDAINGAGAWLRNPLVWILDFVRINRPEALS